ncbi:hypothetical protein Q9966_007887 [Columba livia]|nr:hypothetical protein Q9966_007887 [Columba livia]
MQGQGRCSEERGTFPTAPPPREPVARRGSAPRRSSRLPRAARPTCSEAGCGRRWRRCCARRCSRSARRPSRRPSGRRGPEPAASGPRSCWSSCTGGWRPACSAPSTTPCSPSRRAGSTTPAARPGLGRPPTRGSGSPSTCGAPRRGLTEFHMIPQDTRSTFLKHTACAKAASWGSLARRTSTSAAPRCTCPPSSCAAPPPALAAATSTRKIMSLSQWAALVCPSKKKRQKA